MTLPTLNADQERALDEILDASTRRLPHLLTGYAGTGKTTLLQAVTVALQARHRKVMLCAPTHKAVAVIGTKMREAEIAVSIMTIHSALGLVPDFSGPVVKFNPRKTAPALSHECVIIDECSMIGAELFELISTMLHARFVLFVGDPAQLPPVNEKASPCFATPSRSNLATIVRQARDNPILGAAHVIRESQGGRMDYSWVHPVKRGTAGIFIPAEPLVWMKKAFTSLDFDKDPDCFRYLCWTNARVAEVNRIVRKWRYGPHIPTPFMKGEPILLRQPVAIEVEDSITSKTRIEVLFTTNQEAAVVKIHESVIADVFNGIRVSIPTWRVWLRRDDGLVHPVEIERDRKAARKALAAVKKTIDKGGGKWADYHKLREALVKMQSVYALTVHCSQGSTFGSVFLDVADVKRRAPSNRLECQQMFYVAATRPTTALMLVNP